MAYRYTRISNLNYIDEVFHNIAYNIPHPDEQGYEGQDDSELLKWECVDDRFSTGFGSTYEVVINDFPVREDAVEITIFGDMWLHVETIKYEEHYMDRWETTELTTKIGRIPYKESLPEVLQRVYPNGTVNLVGDFSSSASTEIDLDNVWNYLQGLSNYPDFFIFNGVTKTQASNGKNYTIQKIKDIDNFCKQRKIKACCVFTENLNLGSMTVRDWAEIFATTTKMLKFSVLEWLTHHLSLLETNYNFGDNNTRLDDLFGDNSLTVNGYYMLRYITDRNLDNGWLCYEELVYTSIKRFILEQLFFLHRECFYISLLYKSVYAAFKNSTYDYYYGTQDKPYNLLANLQGNEQCTTIDDSGETVHHSGKYADDQYWNPFKNSGQLVGICLHTDFTEHLWACQQGHSSCYDEFVNMRPDNPANLLPERLNKSSELPSVIPPIFQGTGCPWFTISVDNRRSYANEAGYACPIDIWVTRDNYSASITIRLHTKKDKPDLYQSIEFGKMTSVETENYIFPLYCGGGSLGLASDIDSYYPASGGNRIYKDGNVYDLNMDNICLSNSNILHPTKFWKATFSNFKVLTPEGIWRSIFAHEQTASVVPYPSPGSPPPDYAVHLNPPIHNLGASYDGAFPFLMQNWGSVGSQHIKYRNWLCREPIDNKKYDFSSRLDSIRIGLRNSIGHGQYLSYGSIPKCWRSWDKEIPSGEFTYNGKKYLAVPCGWDGRLWYYGYHLDIHNDTWEIDDVVNEFEQYYYKQNARIDDKLIIELGDIDV